MHSLDYLFFYSTNPPDFQIKGSIVSFLSFGGMKISFRITGFYYQLIIVKLILNQLGLC